MSAALRILVVVGAYPPALAHGGTAYAAHHLSKSLIRIGHDVFVLTTNRSGSDRLQVTSEDTVWDGVPVRYCRWVKSPIPYHSPEIALQVIRRAQAYNVALISSSWTGYGVLGGLACLRSGLPYVVYSHGCYAPARLEKSRLRKKAWWWAFDRHLYNNASAVVALTGAEVGQLRSVGVTARIEQIRNGVDLPCAADSLPRSRLEECFPTLGRHRYVLFLGRLEPIKGLDILIRAFSTVASQIDNVLLVIAGPDERGYARVIREQAQRCGLAARVVFTGLVAGQSKTALLRHADLFVLPSLGEGMPVAALEALASGVPVLLTTGCGLPEVEGANAGRIVRPQPDEVASQMKAMLSNDALLCEMGHNAERLAATHFSWEEVAQETAAMCRRILAREEVVARAK